MCASANWNSKSKRTPRHHLKSIFRHNTLSFFTCDIYLPFMTILNKCCLFVYKYTCHWGEKENREMNMRKEAPDSDRPIHHTFHFQPYYVWNGSLALPKLVVFNNVLECARLCLVSRLYGTRGQSTQAKQSIQNPQNHPPTFDTGLSRVRAQHLGFERKGVLNVQWYRNK